MSTLTHDALLRGAIDGDEAALSNLVRAYHDRVYRFGVRVCRDRFDAEDAVQEAFMKLARRPDVQRDRGALSWLMTVVRNTCLRMLRPFVRERQRLGERVEADHAPTSTDDPHAALARWRAVSVIHAAIAQLERTYREVLILRDLEGMSGLEVSAALGITEAAMKSRLHRARQLVRQQLLGSDELRPLLGR